MTNLRYSYRIYPTETQCVALAQTFGCVRVVWNDALARAKVAGAVYPGFAETSRLLTVSKKTTERAWLNGVSSVPVQQSLRNLDAAFQRFFRGLKGKGPKAGFPVWKTKNGRQAAEFTRSSFKLNNGKLHLAKIGPLKVAWSRKLPSDPKTATVTLDCAGRYHISFTVEKEDVPFTEGTDVGVDLGIKVFAALSTGELIFAPSYKRLEKRIGKEQAKLARCKNGSMRRERSRLKIAKLNAKLGDIRKDFLEKISTRLVRTHSSIVLEDLNVTGMVKNHNLARAISRQGWRTFRTMVESKCSRYGRKVRIVNRWTPTSQLCSVCGYTWGRVGLEVRKIVCAGCGIMQDRDINAAKNIVAAGQAETQNEHGGQIRHHSRKGVDAQPVEVLTFRAAPIILDPQV